MSLPKHRIAIVDATPVTRRGLRSFVDSQGDLVTVIEAAIPGDALRLIRRDPPDLIISEALFTETEGVFELLHELRSMGFRIPVLVFSHLNEQVIASRVLQAGACGFLMKSAPENVLGEAIRKLLSGKIYLSRDMTERAVNHLSSASPRIHKGGEVRDLTNRELEVLDLVGAGMTSKDIADALGISLKTVESHRSHILAKLSLETSAELICYATQWRNLSNHRGWSEFTAAGI